MACGGRDADLLRIGERCACAVVAAVSTDIKISMTAIAARAPLLPPTCPKIALLDTFSFLLELTLPPSLAFLAGGLGFRRFRSLFCGLHGPLGADELGTLAALPGVDFSLDLVDRARGGLTLLHIHGGYHDAWP
jgi:hypothetical protein